MQFIQSLWPKLKKRKEAGAIGLRVSNATGTKSKSVAWLADKMFCDFASAATNTVSFSAGTID